MGVLQTNGLKHPPGTHSFDWSISGDDFYFFNGRTVNDNNGLMSLKNDDIWKFDFNTRSWSNLGKINLSDYSYSMFKSNADESGSTMFLIHQRQKTQFLNLTFKIILCLLMISQINILE